MSSRFPYVGEHGSRHAHPGTLNGKRLDRDVRTVTKGEHLHLHFGDDITAHGVFVEFTGTHIVLDHTVTTSHTPIAVNDPYVTDVDGGVLVDPDPPLPSAPADLE